VISAGATTTLASSVNRRIPSKRAVADASNTTPSERRLLLRGIEAVTGVVGVLSAGVVTCAVLLESLRRHLRHLDDLRIAFTPRLSTHDVPSAENHNG
jgi:hypothetical protein